MILRIEELGPREASRFDQGQHLKCARQSGTRAQACTWASSALCGCEGSASDLLARALLQAAFPVSALPGLSLLGSQVQKSSLFLKKTPQLFEAAPFNSRHCLDLFIADQRPNSPLPPSARERPAPLGHAREASREWRKPQGRRQSDNPAVAARLVGTVGSGHVLWVPRCELFLLCFKQLYKLLFIEDTMYIYFR